MRGGAGGLESFPGTVRGLGRNYTDGVELLEIHIDKAAGRELPTTEGQRVPITLVVGGREYEAGLRSTADCGYVWISPDLTDDTGRDVRLAHVLRDAGVEKNQQVELKTAGSVVTLHTAGA